MPAFCQIELTLVIGDRLFNLPITVEGREEANETNMEIDNDNNGGGGNGEKKDQEPNDGKPEQRKQNISDAASPKPPQSAPHPDGKQVEQMAEVEMAIEDVEDGIVTRISNYPSSYSHVEFHNGNLPLNFNQEIHEWSKNTVLENNDIYIWKFFHVFFYSCAPSKLGVHRSCRQRLKVRLLLYRTYYSPSKLH
jgi:hypothetical protein